MTNSRLRQCVCVCVGGWVGGGGQAYSWISTTHGLIMGGCWLQVGFSGACGCMRGELIWTCFVWAEWSTPDSFWVPSHRLFFASSEQKWITQTIYTDSKQASRLLINAKCQAERHKSHSFYVSGVMRSGMYCVVIYFVMSLFNDGQ